MEIAFEIFGQFYQLFHLKMRRNISIANDTPYGLTNYIQTQDKKSKEVVKN